MEIGLFIALLAGAWVYSDAKSRNSSHPILWGIATFSLALVFLPLYLILRPPKQPLEVRKTPVLCPHCGKYYESPATFCPHCGNKIND